ncbi:hypothetical protein MBLNU13_g11199t1 [Cladosporium sp. NU13]
MLNDQANRPAKSDNPGDIEVSRSPTGYSVGRESFEAPFDRKQDSISPSQLSTPAHTQHSGSPLLKPPQSSGGSLTWISSVLDSEEHQDALKLGPGSEKDFTVQDNKFAFSPGQLNKLLNPKSLAAYAALGGIRGIEHGLRTNIDSGLSVDESVLDGNVRQKSPFKQDAFFGLFMPPATTQQDGACNSVSAATSLYYPSPEILLDPWERSLYKRKANPDKPADITACDDTSLRKVWPSITSVLFPFLEDIFLNDALPKEVAPVDVFGESPKSQPWSETRRDLMRSAVGRYEPLKHNRPAFPRTTVDTASFSVDPSFDNIPPSPFTSLSNVKVINRRPSTSTSMQLLRSATRLWAFIIALASIPSKALASPLPYAEGSLSIVPGTPIGLYVACTIPVAAGIIGCSLTWKHGLFNSSWRDCLGMLSLMASIVWTCLVHWDKAPDFRKVVLASCHGLIYNFTLQLCMSRYGRLLPEAWAINCGFPLVALLLRFLDTLLIVAPNGEEAPTVPSSITDLIWSGFLRWATSPLHFTSWAILVKVAFYTCDAVINRHNPSPPTTLWGRFVVRIACSMEKLRGRFRRANSEGHTDQGTVTANAHHAGVADNDIALNNMSQHLTSDQPAVEEQTGRSSHADARPIAPQSS